MNEAVNHLHLGVNVDHVATLRQARYRTMPTAHQVEPSVVEATRMALAAGAHSITVHLRADRRHIQDADVHALRAERGMLLNLEMGNTPEIVEIALRVKPDFACLVPEQREEVTTEGGLDAAGTRQSLEPTVRALEANGTRVSLFIDPEPEQVRTAAAVGASMIELHTGTFANETGAARAAEAVRLAAAAELAHGLGLQVNAGHGLTTGNLRELFGVPHLAELNIGHHLVSRAVAVGLAAAVQEMLAVMAEYPGGKPSEAG
ncbi:MAG: pyridoxine 5'-phosphate synthase [Verrucomicrobiales bacterium]|nr:pyridoxine 5'-phosphate synthase [Verrucomicrobiales bacterium]